MEGADLLGGVCGEGVRNGCLTGDDEIRLSEWLNGCWQGCREMYPCSSWVRVWCIYLEILQNNEGLSCHAA